MVAPAPKPQRPVVDPEQALRRALRSSLGRFATGVAVVTFYDEGAVRGLTINSVTAVSMDPPLALVSVDKAARAHGPLFGGAPFCINVLGAEQEAIARRFAGSPIDPPIHWVHGTHAPRLGGTLAHFDCRVWRAYDAGDHTLVLGLIVDFARREGDALGFYASRFTIVSEPQLGQEDLF
jgi:flavin reductase